MRILLIFTILIYTHNIYAQKIGEVTGLKIPRYVSLKSDNSNLRVGPSVSYPIKLKYIIENYPVEIIEEYEVWRNIIDFKGNKGWIHKSLLRGDRYAIIKLSNTHIYNIPEGKKIGVIHKNNITKLSKCLTNWCLIKKDKARGWVRKKDLWGVYKREVYNVGFDQKIINIYWKLILYFN